MDVIRRHIILKSSLFMLCIFLSVSCRNRAVQNDNVDILTLRGPSAMSMLFMMDELDNLNGYQLNYEIFDEPLQVRARLLKEEPEMALIPTNMAANLYNKGVPYQLAAIPVWGTVMVFGRDSLIKNWADLKGHRIHLMARGMTPDILFRFLAAENGLDPDKDMILDYSFPSHSDLANAVIAGLSDIAVLSEPMVSQVRIKNKNVRLIFDLEQEWGKIFKNDFAIPQTSLVVNAGFAAKNRDFVTVFIEKYGEYCKQLSSDTHGAALLAVSFGILPDTITAKDAIPGCNMSVIPSWMVKERVDAYLRVFYNFNPESIGGKLPDENFFFKK